MANYNLLHFSLMLNAQSSSLCILLFLNLQAESFLKDRIFGFNSCMMKSPFSYVVCSKSWNLLL